MLKKDSEYIHKVLQGMNATAAVNGFFTAFYPLVGDAKAVQPYCNYTLSQLSKPTKDRLRAYNISFDIVAKNYDQVTQAADMLQEYFEQNEGTFRFTGSEASFINEMDSCVVTNNYNFKIS
jgi:GH35 family endo-1,4-beta-xylanase